MRPLGATPEELRGLVTQSPPRVPSRVCQMTVNKRVGVFFVWLFFCLSVCLFLPVLESQHLLELESELEKGRWTCLLTFPGAVP